MTRDTRLETRDSTASQKTSRPASPVPRPETLADWLSYQERLHPSTIDLGLERLRIVLARLDWKRPACPIITVGGTNGKGSCVALLESILHAAGYKVGTFTSPHLIRYNERIRIDGREVTDTELVEAFARIESARADVSLTFFEFNTLAALLCFSNASLDAIVLEVGLGGRLDAVNVVDADVAIVSSIALDHCEWLGNDVESIGREKAGIFRAHRPAVFGARAIPQSIAAAAASLNAKLLRLGHEFDFDATDSTWSWRSAQRALNDLPRPALPGGVQFENAATVLTALDALSERLPLSAEAVKRGLQAVSLPGRFQVVRRRSEWLLDVAHNPAAAATLARNLAERSCEGRTLAVCGVLADKDIEGVITAVRDEVDLWIVAGLDAGRAHPTVELAKIVRKAAAGADVQVAQDVAAACRLAEGLATQRDRIVVFGSFYTVGPALEWLTNH